MMAADDHRNGRQERRGAGAAAPALRGTLRINEPMSRHTSWRAGGVAERYFRPADLDDLAAYLRSLPGDEPLAWVGLGSNLLVRDGGIRGSVIVTSGVLKSISLIGEAMVRVEAGVACAKVARYCAGARLGGAEFLVGIPGTMGGALAMNAGAFGGETWRLVRAVETIDRRGRRALRTPDQYEIGYRSVRGPGEEWFIAAHLGLQPEEDPGRVRARMQELLASRAAAQPIGQPSCGSVFRNPPGDHAARLIEASGLKGCCIGAACVSEKHANFIINRGGATAGDIEALIRHVQDTVERLHGVRLIPEVHIIGEPRAPDGGRSDV